MSSDLSSAPGMHTPTQKLLATPELRQDFFALLLLEELIARDGIPHQGYGFVSDSDDATLHRLYELIETGLFGSVSDSLGDDDLQKWRSGQDVRDLVSMNNDSFASVAYNAYGREVSADGVVAAKGALRRICASRKAWFLEQIDMSESNAAVQVMRNMSGRVGAIM